MHPATWLCASSKGLTATALGALYTEHAVDGLLGLVLAPPAFTSGSAWTPTALGTLSYSVSASYSPPTDYVRLPVTSPLPTLTYRPQTLRMCPPLPCTPRTCDCSRGRGYAPCSRSRSARRMVDALRTSSSVHHSCSSLNPMRVLQVCFLRPHPRHLFLRTLTRTLTPRRRWLATSRRLRSGTRSGLRGTPSQPR